MAPWVGCGAASHPRSTSHPTQAFVTTDPQADHSHRRLHSRHLEWVLMDYIPRETSLTRGINGWWWWWWCVFMTEH